MARAGLSVIGRSLGVGVGAGSCPVRFRSTVGTTQDQHPLHWRSVHFRCPGAHHWIFRQAFAQHYSRPKFVVEVGTAQPLELVIPQIDAYALDELALPGWRHRRLAAGQSFIVDHGRRSVIPERLADALLGREKDVITPRQYYDFAHFSDTLMTDLEVLELPKVWAVGGDGGMGDIGYQNTSKVILPESPQREGRHARHPTLLQHRRTKLRFNAHARWQ